MGTDIHAVAQAKVKSKWQDVPMKWEQDRHYMLFAWLANVRNGFGFAGVATHEPIKPLASPRGLPTDFKMDGDVHPTDLACIAPHRLKYLDNEEKLAPTVWMGDHTHSWLTFDEILTGQRPGKTWKTGVVDLAFVKTWDGVTAPDNYSGGISGPGIVVALSPAHVNEKTTHVQISWRGEEADFNYFLEEVERLKKEHGEGRIVFGFDS